MGFPPLLEPVPQLRAGCAAPLPQPLGPVRISGAGFLFPLTENNLKKISFKTQCFFRAFLYGFTRNYISLKTSSKPS